MVHAGLDCAMRAIEVGEDRLLRVVERPLPQPGPGEVAVDVAFCGICGSDLHFRDVPALFPAGTVPGHEFSGSIATLGEGVDGWEAGDRVCVLPFAQCGECAACLAGTEQVCATAIANGVGLGTGRPGGYADRVVVDARMLFALPEAVDDRAGTLVEPLAVAVHAHTRARPEPGDALMVIGAGPIGLLTALVARERGNEVVVVSRNPARARRAEQLGLATVTPEDAATVAQAGAQPAVVLECAGTGSALGLALELVAPLGRVVIVGVAPEPFALDSIPRHLQGGRDPRLVHLRPRRLPRSDRIARCQPDSQRRADRRGRRLRERRGDVPLADVAGEQPGEGAPDPRAQRLTNGSLSHRLRRGAVRRATDWSAPVRARNARSIVRSSAP